MDTRIGAENADRMHEALGRRYAGCATTWTGHGWGMMGGSGTMGASSGGARGWGAMMGSDLSWMHNRSWQHMSRGDWQRAGGYMMGTGWMMGTGGSEWSTGAVIAVVLVALLLGALVVYVALRRPWRRGPSQPRTAYSPHRTAPGSRPQPRSQPKRQLVAPRRFRLHLLLPALADSD